MNPCNIEFAFIPEKCRQCRSLNSGYDLCCSFVKERVFLTEFDIKRLEKAGVENLKRMSKGKIRNHSYAFINSNENGNCVFYDGHTKICEIYCIRPIDCRIFPLDIDMKDGKYYWICYNCCGHVNVPDGTLQKIERKFLPHLLPYLEVYAELSTEMFEREEFRVIRKINFEGANTDLRYRY